MNRERYPVPSKLEKDKIRRSLNMKPNEKFWRCKAKSMIKVRMFEKQGDFSHSGPKHVCEECRCTRTAGTGTDHYGIGYCYEHENVKGMTDRSIELMNEATKAAIRQGFPDRIYKYETNDHFIERVRQSAEESGGMTDLREELVLMRSKLQELMSLFESERDELTEGYDKRGNPKAMTDATYIGLTAKLAETIGRLSEKNLKITEQDYVHVDQINLWFASVLRIIQRQLESGYPEEYEKIVAEIKLVPAMKKGRMK